MCVLQTEHEAVSLELPLYLLLFSLHDFCICRQTRPGSPEAAPKTVPAKEGTFIARISSVPWGLNARTVLMAAVTVPKLVREPWGMDRVCSWWICQKQGKKGLRLLGLRGQDPRWTTVDTGLGTTAGSRLAVYLPAVGLPR